MGYSDEDIRAYRATDFPDVEIWVTARDRGVPDFATFQKMEDGGFEDYEDWLAADNAGFDKNNEWFVAKEGGFPSRASWLIAREQGAATFEEYQLRNPPSTATSRPDVPDASLATGVAFDKTQEASPASPPSTAPESTHQPSQDDRGGLRPQLAFERLQSQPVPEPPPLEQERGEVADMTTTVPTPPLETTEEPTPPVPSFTMEQFEGDPENSRLFLWWQALREGDRLEFEISDFAYILDMPDGDVMEAEEWLESHDPDTYKYEVWGSRIVCSEGTIRKLEEVLAEG